jgi:Core binding factor beta subunit
MLHSAAPSSFNMFPFGHHPPPPQHPGAGGHPHGVVPPPPPVPHHPHHVGGGDMFHHQQVAQEPPPKPRFLFKMPRVVPNQKEKFESDEFLKRHSREGEVSFAICNDLKILNVI